MAEAVDPNAASVQVAVRVRPMSERELKGNTLPVVTASSDKKEVTLIRGAGNRQQRQTYSFDAVFSDYSSQRVAHEGLADTSAHVRARLAQDL